MQYLKYLYNINNLVVLILDLLCSGLYIYIRLKMKKSENNKMNTYYIVSNLMGYIITFIAKIRKGKSSTSNGIINTLEIKLMNQANDDMQKVISYFPKINFQKINYILFSLNLNDDIFYQNQGEITEMIMNECNIINGMYNDFINCKSVKEHIENYIEAFYVFYIRGIYVYSKTWRYSYITRMTSKYLSDKTMNIKDVAIQKEFYLRKYSVLFEDEISLEKGNILSHSKSAKDKGSKEHKILQGHIYEETVYYISAKQRHGDEISSEKELYTNNLLIKDRTIYNNFNSLIRYFEMRSFLLAIRYNLYWHLIHLFKRKLDFEDWILTDKCKYRKKKYYFDSCIRYFKSLANVDILVNDYSDCEDVGKENTMTYKRYEEYVLTFDLRDTIGNYNTHEFSFIRKILNQLSKVYSTYDNTAYKEPNVMLKQAYFLFEHVIKNRIEDYKEEQKKRNKGGYYNNYDEY